MPIVRLHNTGAIGVIKDLPDYDIPVEGWSDSLNVRFVDDRVKRYEGDEDVFNYSMSGAVTVSQSILESPWAVFPVQADNDYYWLYAGKNNVHIATSQKNTENINKLDSTASATLQYSATPTMRWNGGVLAGLPWMTNGVDEPQVWATPASGNRLEDAQWDISASVSGTSSASGGVGPTSWASRTAGAVTCQIFRTYREYGIAMNTTEGGTSYPRRIRWSHPAVSGSQPISWEDTDSAVEASYKDMDDTAGEITDGLQLRDAFVIYKEDSSYLMQWTGGRLIMSFRPLFQTVSAMSHDCAQEFYGKHVVLTKDRDLIVHDGQEVQSVLNGRWRNYLYNQINEDYESNCFVAVDTQNTEVLACYPESGAGVANWATHALVWNWRSNTLYVRQLRRASDIKSGVILGAGTGAFTWTSITGTWDDTVRTWDERGYQVAGDQLLLSRPADTASASSLAQLLKMNSGYTFDGINMNCYVERVGLPIAGTDQRGQPKVNQEDFKYIKAVWPYFDAPAGTTFDIYVGSQAHASDPVTWSGPHTYTVGTTLKIDVRLTGRYISFKVASSYAGPWTFTGYDLDLDIVGRY